MTPNSDSKTVLYRMVTAPSPAFEPQVGWVYEMLPTSGSWLKLRLAALPSGEDFSGTFDISLRVDDVGRHFEEVAAA